MSIENEHGKTEIVKKKTEKIEKANIDNERLDWWKNIALSKVEGQRDFENNTEKKLRPKSNTEHLEKTAQLDEQRLSWWKEMAIEASQQK